MSPRDVSEDACQDEPNSEPLVVVLNGNDSYEPGNGALLGLPHLLAVHINHEVVLFGSPTALTAAAYNVLAIVASTQAREEIAEEYRRRANPTVSEPRGDSQHLPEEGRR